MSLLKTGKEYRRTLMKTFTPAGRYFLSEINSAVVSGFLLLGPTTVNSGDAIGLH